MDAKVNMSNADRVIRFILGGAVFGFGLAFWPVGAVLGGLFAAVLWMSAWMGYCHIYKVLGIDTRNLGKRNAG